jgi:hypothetical protein
MSNVGVVHDEVVVPDNGGTLRLGSAMDLYMFAYDVTVADLQRRPASVIFCVLGLMAYNSANMDGIRLTYFSPAGYIGMSHHSG